MSDNGTGFREDSVAALEMGIGLGATSGRLERMYAGEHTFSIKEGGTEVRIVIPLRWPAGVQEVERGTAAAADRRR